MRIHGESDQNLTKYLTRLEAKLPITEFYRKLLEDQKLDPKNFTVSYIETPDQKYAVIFGQHSYKRNAERMNQSRNHIIRETLRILSNPVLASYIIQFAIEWNEELNDVVSYNRDDGIKSVAVMDELSKNIFVFECGFAYIRLKTVWNPKSEKFVLSSDTIGIRLNLNGTIEFREERIKEFSRRWNDRYIL